ESLGQRALRSGGATQYFFQVITAQIAQDRIGDARSTVARAAQLLPAGSTARGEFPAFIALAEREHGAADSLSRQLWRERQGNAELKARTAGALAALAETRGRLAEAAQYRRERMAASEERGLPYDYIESATQLARLELQYRNRPAEALATVEAALARHPLDSTPPADRPYLALAEFYASAGRVDQARRLLREYETTVPEGVRRGERMRGGAYGHVLEAEGRVAEAASAYRDLYQRFGLCGSCGLFELAQLYDRAGQRDSARVVYEQFVTTPTWLGRLIADPAWLAPAYKRLGELYEAKGERPKAADYYGKFVELWKDADPELQPGVKEVRTRLARLAQEPGA
ncbi:MAG: tetratricopeptide repeat protein, partial [Gemmatimonadales bacterium]